ncbi:small conductance mechanosensitive channel [Paenibacillus cellulosilyticus]|uniref:Small conductance mechanosensitive channel n=1 Tax=Paenibacillus cellulosilyticus TaxID=375489 RepID=A0A2V2Z9M9_9BACL|nr:mechanosensitive ion channel family protein [Paenibacillus cellulosilyticus]PWW08831.1 small conductance mechanosensitive channel [Paenibacillus cellulosilyticus]QKS48380.1 mechanosensitive ion channel family protein [Paenibacillus cellulosilyticus]
MGITQAWNEVVDWLSSHERWADIGLSIVRVAAILVIGRVVELVIHKSINRMMIEREMKQASYTRRVLTVGKLLKNVSTYLIYFVGALLILAEFNVNLAPLLAGAGVISLAIGFGAQSLVKDIITGFFIILEDQFAVGDVIQVGQFKGTVELIGLRTTRVKSWTGEMHIIPNGMINEVTNFSMNNSVAFVDIAIAYEEDVDRAIEIMKKTLESDTLVLEHTTGKPQVLGVQTLGPEQVTLRVIVECLPTMQVVVSRALNAIIKRAFDEHHIDLPYPRMVTYQRTERGEIRNGT